MKKTLLLTSLLLALSATLALAGGVNLAWGPLCYTEGVDSPPTYGLTETVFTCLTNASAGNRLMTASFMMDVSLGDMVGSEMLIRGQSDSPALPDYWKVSIAPSADCRAGRASFVSNFQGVIADPPVCEDWTGGAGFNAPNITWHDDIIEFALGVAIDDGFPFTTVPGVEYYAGQVSLLNSKAVGVGSCAGCATGMIFGLNTVTAAGKAGLRYDYQEVIPGGNQCILWNNPVAHPCGPIVPARNSTWGQVKSLYR